MKQRKDKPKTWSRKGQCPSCNVKTGSKHAKECVFDYNNELKNTTMKFTQKEFELLFNALDVYATEIYDARYYGEVDDYGTKRQVQATLKAIKALEKKLNNI